MSNEPTPRLSWWDRVVVPRAVNHVLDTPAVAAARKSVLDGLSGEVVEVGFGSGLSLANYPSAVTHVLAVDPDDTGWNISRQHRDLAESRGLRVDRVGRDAQRLPFADESVHTLVTLWTLCTVPDLEAALSEIERVLRPGGRFVFAEHGLSSRPRRQRIERFVEPVWRPLAGGCHLTREPWQALRPEAFEAIDVRRPAASQGLPPGTRIGWATHG